MEKPEGLQKRCRWEVDEKFCFFQLNQESQEGEKKAMLHFDNYFFWATSYDFIRSGESSGTQGADIRGMKANRTGWKSKTDLK